MFCKKCGNQLGDGAVFCANCGESLHQEPTTPAYATMPTKKKSKKLPFILGAVVLVVVAVIVIAMNWNGKIDYVATAKAYEPFAQSQNLPGTCGAVLDQYLSEPKWTSTMIDDTAHVSVSGTLKGATDKISITITVSPGETEDSATFDFAQATINGNQTTDSDEVALFMLALLDAYNSGQELFDPYMYF